MDVKTWSLCNFRPNLDRVEVQAFWKGITQNDNI